MQSSSATEAVISVLPAVALLTIIGAIAWALLTLRRRKSKRPAGRGVAVLGICTAILGVLNGIIDLTVKSRGARLSVPDPGRVALENFYRYTTDDCPRAWAMIHTARRAEVASVVRSAEDFCSTYATTNEYRNLSILPIHSDGPARVYVVNFDVQDTYPSATLYGYRHRQVREAIQNQILNYDAVVNAFVWDLSRNYVIPDRERIRQAVGDYLADRTMDFIFSPEAVAEVGRYLKLRRIAGGPVAPVWTHFIQRITMRTENDEWKLRSGLYPPTLRAAYPSGAALAEK